MKREEKQSDNSEEEGFYPNEIEISEKAIEDITFRNWAKIINEDHAFQTKYLPSAGLVKKEPIHSMFFQPIIRTQNYSNNQPTKQKLREGQGQHPYTLYASNKNYTLIYSRCPEEPIQNSRIFLKNQVKLEHVGNREVRASKKMPDFVDVLPKSEEDQLKENDNNFLRLDSRFESGNLHCAYKNKEKEQYILFIENDTNSIGYNQWFYFSVERMKPNKIYTFRIVNFKKKHSFYRMGAKPYVFSTKQFENEGDGWKKRGFNIEYEESSIRDDPPTNYYFCLSFDLKFQYEGDYILIAMGLPYSYTKLTNFLKEVSSIQSFDHEVSVKIKTVCKTIGGNEIPEVTIKKKTSQQVNKKMIIIMARQHPGQVWSSFMVEGIIRHLLNLPYSWEKQKSRPKEQIRLLLNKYIFKIYPMINVDGVIYGNFRCDLTGVDLNRKWKETYKLLYPQISEIKKQIRSFTSNYQISCCLDLHGHSKNFNIFCYSCKQNPQTCRILPFMIQQKNPKFHFPSCTFGLSKYKQTTARAAIFKLINNESVLTIQSSFYGSKIDGKIQEFNPIDIFQMGRDIVDTLWPYLEKYGKKYLEAKQQIKKNLEKYLNYDAVTENDSGSESQPEADEINLNEKLIQIFDEKFVNEKTLYVDKNQEDQQLLSKKQESLLIDTLEPLKIKETDFLEQISMTSPKKMYGSYLNRKPMALSKQFKTIDLKGQTQKAFQEKATPQNRTTARINTPKINESEGNAEFETTNIEKSPFWSVRTPLRNKIRIQRKKSINQSPQLTKNEVRMKKNLFSSLNQRTPILRNRTINPIQIQEEEQNKKEEDEGRVRMINKRFNSAIRMSHKLHGSLFDETIYNQDQSSLMNVLLQNKRILQDQKEKRIIEASYRARRSSSNRFRRLDDKLERISLFDSKSGKQLLISPRKNI